MASIEQAFFSASVYWRFAAGAYLSTVMELLLILIQEDINLSILQLHNLLKLSFGWLYMVGNMDLLEQYHQKHGILNIALI